MAFMYRARTHTHGPGLESVQHPDTLCAGDFLSAL
jgi:hypothetical protein